MMSSLHCTITVYLVWYFPQYCYQLYLLVYHESFAYNWPQRPCCTTVNYMPSSFIFNRQSSRIRLKCDSWLRVKFTHKIFWINLKYRCNFHIEHLPIRREDEIRIMDKIISVKWKLIINGSSVCTYKILLHANHTCFCHIQGGRIFC